MKPQLKLWFVPLLVGAFQWAGCANVKETPSPEKGVSSTTKESDSDSFKKYGQEFKGKIGKTYAESVEWYPETKKPKPESPNVLILLLDDVGFSQLGSYGGLAQTPNIDALAADGLRYNNFHTTALCSPSRATLMASRNPHRIGLGSHALTAMGFPGYNGTPPESAKSIAKDFQHAGYETFALGKWDHTPLPEASQSGPFLHWASGEGFDHYYGFMAADADDFRSLVWNDHHPTENWVGKSNYHLTTDLADRAIANITSHVSIYPDRPLFMFWAPSAMHSPHQVEKKYIDMYRGKFDMGWDKAREQIFAKQMEMKLLPAGTKLSDGIPEIPRWDSLSPDQKKLYARQMEVFAGMLTQTDEQVGRIIAALKRTGQYDNTLIILTSDNGTSGEGGLNGLYNESLVINSMQANLEENMKHYDEWGGPNTYPHYHAGWAMAGNTPFKYCKQIVHNGGIADPLIITWPKGIKAKGEIRNQYSFITDIMATALEATGTPFLEEIDGIKQMSLDGKSLVYSFDNSSAPSTRTEQYYEQLGNRAMYKDGWKAVTIHGNRMPWVVAGTFPFDKDVWELYNLNEDFSETNDLAAKNPEKLEELKKLWEEQAWKNNVFPLYDDIANRVATQFNRAFGDRKSFTYYWPGAERIPEAVSAPIKNTSHTIETTLNLKGDEEGVLVACGGVNSGYALFIADHKLHYEYNYFNQKRYQIASSVLPPGKVDIKFNFIKTGQLKGTGELYVNGEKVGEGAIDQTVPGSFSLSETFDVGVDNGTPVSNDYKQKDHFPFTGQIDKVTINLAADNRNEEIKATNPAVD
ncbi:MAG: arylsulfatase [Deltaproteobacteria bacterium]|nr:arylsulfatase [Deltaproteobacteria bacterium]